MQEKANYTTEEEPDEPGEALSLQLSGEILAAETKPKGKPTYLSRFVRSGKVRRSDNTDSDLFIEPAALEAAISKFDKKAVFVDHAGFFAYPSLQRLAGVTAAPRFNHADQSIEGEIHLNNTTAGQLAKDVIADLLADPNQAPDIGLSIVFFPRFAPRDDSSQPRRIIEVRHVESVDLVFQPAADGRIIQALSTYAQQENQTMTKPITETQEQTIDPPAAPAPNTAAAWQDALAETASASLLAASGLPEASRQRLGLTKFNNPQELKAAIEAERAYLAALNADSVINIGSYAPRSPQIGGMLTSLDRIQFALDALFSGGRPPQGIQPLSGVRELYHLLSGDYEMTGVFQGDRIQLANVNSSTMANMVANALNKVVAQEFINYPQWWTPIVVASDFDNMQAVKWITLGGVGELPVVAEGAAYTELTWDDKYETASFIKKGGYLGITMEAIDKDDTGRLRNAPRALAQAAWLTLSKSLSYIFTQASGVGPDLVDSTALFDGSRANLGTTALSVTSYIAARTAMRKFTEVNSGERLGALTAPKYLLVPPDLEITALQVLASEFDYTYALSNAPSGRVNPLTEGDTFNQRMAFARDRVIVVDLWTDTNDWAAVADPRLYPTIGLGFRYGRVPEIFSVASPTAGLMFTNDTMPVKVRFVYACGPIDWRGLYKANVA